VKTLFHAPSDAVDVLQLEAEQNSGQVVLGDHHEPVGLLQVGPDLAEKHVRRDADRAGEAFADLLAQGAFHLHDQLPRNRHLPFGTHKRRKEGVEVEEQPLHRGFGR
jgi:hypothetical protein